MYLSGDGNKVLTEFLTCLHYCIWYLSLPRSKVLMKDSILQIAYGNIQALCYHNVTLVIRHSNICVDKGKSSEDMFKIRPLGRFALWVLLNWD